MTEQISVNSSLTKEEFFYLKDEVERLMRSMIRRYNPSAFLPFEDIANDCLTTLILRHFFDRYDRNRAKLTTYLRCGIKNFLIDEERKLQSRINTTSYDTEIRTDLTLLQIIDSGIVEEEYNKQIFLDTVDILKDRKRKVERKSEVEEFKDKVLSEHTVMDMYLRGYKMVEISEIFNVSSAYISRLFAEGIQYLKDEKVDFKFDIKMQKVRNDRNIVCICGSENIDVQSIGWHFLPFFICNNCKKNFTLFSNTPLNGLNKEAREVAITIMEELNKGKELKFISMDNNIDMKKVCIFTKKFWDYFSNEPEIFRKSILREWRSFLNERKRRELANDYNKPKEPNKVVSWTYHIKK